LPQLGQGVVGRAVMRTIVDDMEQLTRWRLNGYRATAMGRAAPQRTSRHDKGQGEAAGSFWRAGQAVGESEAG